MKSVIIIAISVVLFIPTSVFAEYSTIPSWVDRVEGFWYGQEISNNEYVTFVDHIIKRQIVSHEYYEILNNKHVDGIITYNNTAISAGMMSIAFSEWEKLNPDLVFVESPYSPSLSVQEMYWTPFSIKLDSDKVLLGYERDGIIFVSPDYDRVTTINTLMHEIGHVLGLMHINDESHLMYGSERSVDASSYNKRGYAIPNIYQ